MSAPARVARYADCVQQIDVYNLKIKIREVKRVLGIKIYTAFKNKDMAKAEFLFESTKAEVDGYRRTIRRKERWREELRFEYQKGKKGSKTCTDICELKPSGGYYGKLSKVISENYRGDLASSQ